MKKGVYTLLITQINILIFFNVSNDIDQLSGIIAPEFCEKHFVLRCPFRSFPAAFQLRNLFSSQFLCYLRDLLKAGGALRFLEKLLINFIMNYNCCYSPFFSFLSMLFNMKFTIGYGSFKL